MKRIIIILMLALCFVSSVAGQPRVTGIHEYEIGVDNQQFIDIYATEDGGYAACGGAVNNNMEQPCDNWILKTNHQFEVEWSRTYENGALTCIIELDDHGFLAGGSESDDWTNYFFAAMRTGESGELTWNRRYCRGECNGLLELKNGNFLLIGGANWTGNSGQGHLVMIDPDGEVIWERSYQPFENSGSRFTCGRETEDGIIVVGEGLDQAVTYDLCWAVKVDFEGEIIWNTTSRPGGAPWTWSYSMVSASDCGFLIGGKSLQPPVSNIQFIAKINAEGEWQWSRRFGEQDGGCYWQLARWRDDGFAFAGCCLVSSQWVPMVYRLDNDGEVRWRAVGAPDDNPNSFVSLNGVIFGHDGTIVGAGQKGPNEEIHGLLVEIEPEVPGPTIGFRQPDTASICVLPGDSINFEIRATNQWGDPITYAFFLGDQQIAADSTVTIRFNDFGRFLVAGRAYSGGDSAQAVWQVDVVDLYIAAHSPDILNLSIRRLSIVDFAIDIRATGGVENVEYQWFVTNLDNQNEEDAGQQPHTEIEFPDAGTYRVEGQAYRGESLDRVIWNVRVRQGILNIGEELVAAEPGGIERFPVMLFCDGQDTLIWSAEVRTLGESGSDFWTVRQEISAGEIADDDRIEGAIFDGESYFCAGSNGDNPNMIYHLNRQGELLGSFEQPGHSRYGMRDLEWDGELIWGSGEDSVFAVNRDGEVVQRWRGPFNPNYNIAYDPEEGVLWISAITSEIFAHDREGNNLGRSIHRQGLRVYGLSWYKDDPDSSFLYALNIPGNDTVQISKFNPLTDEMSLIHAFPLDSATGFGGAFICRNYDRYQGWVLMTVANVPMASGGDALRVYQVEPNREWLTVHPESGEIPPGESAEVEIRVRTAGWDGSWAFEVGEYEGEVVFEHNGQGGRDVLPVHLRVVEPNEVAPDGEGRPSSFELFTAYPNPFNARTTLRFDLPSETNVRLTIHDLTGRLVERLVNARLSSGQHSVVWDGANLAAGVYLIRLESGGVARIVKGVIVK